MSKNSLSTNEELRQGEFLSSVDGKFKALFQHDSNFVIYGDYATWQADTAQSSGTRVILQDDGNLVIYTQNKRPVWCTNSNSNELSQRMRLTLTNQGQLELDRDGDQIWTSANSNGKKP